MIKQKIRFYAERFKALTRLEKTAVAATAALLLTILGIWLFKPADIGTERVVGELRQLSTNIRRYYQNRPDFWGLNTQTVLDKKIAPNKMRVNSNVLLSSYNTPVEIGSGIEASMLMPGMRNFDIIYRSLNRQQCLELLTYGFSEDFWLGVAGITVNNDRGEQRFGWSNGDYKLPVAKEQARKWCRKENTVLWHYE